MTTHTNAGFTHNGTVFHNLYSSMYVTWLHVSNNLKASLWTPYISDWRFSLGEVHPDLNIKVASIIYKYMTETVVQVIEFVFNTSNGVLIQQATEIKHYLLMMLIFMVMQRPYATNLSLSTSFISLSMKRKLHRTPSRMSLWLVFCQYFSRPF